MRHGDGNWEPPATSAYVDEEQLKLLLKEVPGLLWESTAVVDEFYIPRAGSVDLLAVSIDGSITLVECKLHKNPQIRREVVGQILAYAGGLWRTPYEDFASRFAARAGRTLLDHLQNASGSQITDEDQLRASIHANLQSGTFRLVIAVDHITEELKFVIEWLNGHTASNIEVLALEAEYARDGGVEVLVPRFFGESTAKSAPTVAKMTESDMVATVSELADQAVRAAYERMIAHGREHGHHSAPGTAGMSYWYTVEDRPVSVWAIWPKEKVPSISVSFSSLAHYNKELAAAFLERLHSNPVLASKLTGVSAANLNKNPTIPVPGFLTEPGVLDHLLDSIDEILID